MVVTDGLFAGHENACMKQHECDARGIAVVWSALLFEKRRTEGVENQNCEKALRESGLKESTVLYKN